MTSHNLAGRPDDDEHCQIRELGRPNKAPRGGTYDAGHDTHSADPRSSSAGMAFIGPAFALPGSTDDAGAHEARLMQQYHSQFGTPMSGDGIGATLTLAAPGGSPAEQVRAAKAQAMDILHALDAESLLDHPISEYLRDMEASYNENDPKLVFPKLRAAWTPEEDRLLKVGVRVYGPNTESWPRIAMLVPGRTNKSCRKRWFHSLDPSLHKGPWTAEEDELLRERVVRFPSQWSRVAEGILGRTDDQCAKRWRESLDPEIDRAKWRPEEDRLLLEKFEELGTQWQKIATFFQGRPGLHCRNRWRKIQRIITQKERKSGPIAPKDLSKTLAAVTESVNRRKTAQRSRTQGSHRPHPPTASGQYESSAASTAAATSAVIDSNHALFGFGRMDTSSAMPMPAGSSLYGGPLGPYQQRPSQSQEQLYQAAAQFGIGADSNATLALASMMAPSDARDNMDSVFANDGQPSPGIRQHGLSHSGSPDSAGAMFMPSAEGSLRVPRLQGGAKRSLSVLFSPTEEQRLRLRKLGRRLYGCAAAPGSCEASFADALSLTSHIRLAHPVVASQVPSLNGGGTSPGGRTYLQIPDAGPDGADTAGLSPGTPGGHSVKPYRCAMPGCNHRYKNANGLEYHIFQSRKSNDHLADLLAASAADADGAVLGVALDGGGGGGALFEASDSPRSSEALPADMATGSQALLCREADCLLSFASEQALRQHEAMQHMRPIRRAIKPSHRARAIAAAAGIGGSPLDQPRRASGAFWGQTTIGEVLASPAIDEPAAAAARMGSGSRVAAAVAAAAAANGDAAAAALAAVMAYTPAAHKQALTPGVSSQHMFSPTFPDGSSGVFRHTNHHFASFANQAQAPFLSAPALITELGHEPKTASYFSLGVPGLGAPGQQQQQQAMGAYTPMVLGSMARANTIAMAPPALPSESQTQLADTQDSATHRPGDAGKLQQLDMELMQSVLSPFYPPGGADKPTADHDVHMGEPAPRSQRSDSFDMASLATVPTGAGPLQADPNPQTQSPAMLPKPSLHPQMAAALMSQQSAGPAVAAAIAAAGSTMPLAPWPQGLSSLGLLSVPTANTTRHSMHELGPAQHQYQPPRIYTPQPADLAQFHGQRLMHSAQAPGGGAAVGCPVPGCKQSYADVDALRSHIRFDHTHEDALMAGNYSSPNSPMVGSFLSAQQRPAAPLPAAESLAQQQQQQQLQAVASDRAKAPHWVDTNTWSMWIAAANGQGDPTATATATAMGVTPGVAGVPQAFLQHHQQQQQQQQLQAAAHDPVAEDELLRMFEMVSNDNPAGPN